LRQISTNHNVEAQFIAPETLINLNQTNHNVDVQFIAPNPNRHNHNVDAQFIAPNLTNPNETNHNVDAQLIAPQERTRMNNNQDKTDIGMMGIDPAAPRYNDLNLAGSLGVPTPQEVATPQSSNRIITDDYLSPANQTIRLKPSDLAEPAIEYRHALQPDPAIPDLSAYRQPHGLDIQNNSMLTVDPLLGDVLHYNLPDDVAIHDNPLHADVLVPGLQPPEFQQQVHMLGRPGELDADALTTMHQSATYDTIRQTDYPDVFMDQHGTNNKRRRHFTQLMRALDAVERGTFDEKQG